jgi:hypothetical protein
VTAALEVRVARIERYIKASLPTRNTSLGREHKISVMGLVNVEMG